jgi:phosphate acetyltransferase
MTMITKFIETAKSRDLSVVLPEGKDERIIRAARQMKDEGIASPILLGKFDEIEAAASEAGVSLDGIQLINPAESDKLEAYAEAYVEGREMSINVAKRMVKRPLYYAGMMVRLGDVDTMVAGAVSATSLVIQAGVLAVGLAEGIATPSSFFLMIIPDFQGQKDKPFIYADCAVNIAPNPNQLADIAIASESSAASLLPEAPRVAMLSFSTKGSASHPNIDLVTEALAIAKKKAPGIIIDGEFQADSALIPAVAAKKIKEPSEVAGQANTLIFPDLNSGNIAYKLTQYMAGAKAIGPFLQGFAKPISDLSRGASVDDIVATTAICLAQVGEE